MRSRRPSSIMPRPGSRRLGLPVRGGDIERDEEGREKAPNSGALRTVKAVRMRTHPAGNTWSL